MHSSPCTAFENALFGAAQGLIVESSNYDAARSPSQNDDAQQSLR